MSYKSMNYSSFVNSLNQNKIHFASGKTHHVKGSGLIREPVYALETSGSVEAKVFFHSLASIFKACDSFFKSFPMTEEDRWGLCLSTSHVAGFSVLARTYRGGLQAPHFFKWSVENLLSEIEQNKVTVLSLVPTQIFDIVQANIRAPQSIKRIFAGGAFLSSELLKKAMELGWNIIVCYGSTETFAQMSFAKDGINFKTFEGWEASQNENDELLVKGPGLFVGELKNGVYRPRKASEHNTKDLCVLDSETFKLLGKSNGRLKVKGSYFDFNKFKKDFQSELVKRKLNLDAVFSVVLSEERDGAGVYMVSTLSESCEYLMTLFPEIKGCFYLQSLEKSEIGKIKISKLSDVLKRQVLCL